MPEAQHSLQKWTDQKVKAIMAARSITERAEKESRDLTDDEDKQVKSHLTEAYKFRDKVAQEVKLRDLEKEILEPTTEPARPRLKCRDDAAKTIKRSVDEAFTKWCATPNGDRASEYRGLLMENVSEPERRALQLDKDVSGGYLTAPEKFVAELISDVNNEVFIRSKARVITGDMNTKYTFPRRTNRMARAQWRRERDAPTKDTTLAYGRAELVPERLKAEILVGEDLLNAQGGINADKEVRSEMAYSFGQAEEYASLLGTGAGEPLGVFVASSEGISTTRDIATYNTATQIHPDNLKKAKYSLKAQYLRKAEWLFHRDVMFEISILKDGVNNYLLQPGLRPGDGELLLDRPINVSEFAPSTIAASQYVYILGDFSKYYIVEVKSVKIKLLQEKYAESDEVAYLGKRFIDGKPVVENGFVRGKMGT